MERADSVFTHRSHAEFCVTRRSFMHLLGFVCALLLLLPVSLGHASTLCGSKARRIVSLSPTTTEVLCALGLCDQLVGVTRFDDYPAQVLKLPKIGGYSDPSLEAILSLRPDWVVLTYNGSNRPVSEALSRHHIPWAAYPERTLSDFETMVRAIGQFTHCTPEAEALIQRFQSTWRRIAQITLGKSPRLLLIYDHTPLVAAGPNSLASEWMQQAHLINAYEGPLSYPVLSLESLLTLHPDIIVDLSMVAEAQTRDALAPIRTQLKAQRIPILSHYDSALLRLGPRYPAAILQLLEMIQAAKTHAQP